MCSNSHISKDERGKLSSKAQKCIFLGYGDVTKGYRLYDTIKAHIIHSQDVVFDETSLGIEGGQWENVAQDAIRSVDVSTEVESHDEQKKQMMGKISKLSVIMRITLSLMKNHR